MRRQAEAKPWSSSAKLSTRGRAGGRSRRDGCGGGGAAGGGGGLGAEEGSGEEECGRHGGFVKLEHRHVIL